MFNPNYFFNLFVLLNEQWLAISHCFSSEKIHKGFGDYPQQAGDATTIVASKANACQTP